MDEQKKIISKEMTIDEIFSSFPHKSQHLAQELTNTGLHCVGCQASTWETLEAGMLGHGFADSDIDALVQRLNQILEKTSDLTSITLTERAAEKFKKILKDENKEGWALRFADKPGGCGGFEYNLSFSEKANLSDPKEPDEIYHSHGVEIHVNKKMVPRLIGSEIDFLEGLNGSGFKIMNPNTKGSCSCGSSQSY